MRKKSKDCKWWAKSKADGWGFCSHPELLGYVNGEGGLFCPYFEPTKQKEQRGFF